MKKLAELLQERAEKVKAQKALLDARKEEKRDFTEEEVTTFRNLTTEIEALDTKIKLRKEEEAAEKRAAELDGTPVDTTTGEAEEAEKRKMKKRYSLHKAIRSQLPNHTLDGVEKELHDETLKQARAAGITEIQGILIPGPSQEKRADGQTVTQDGGGYGGNLVAEDLQGPIEFLRPKPVLETLGARLLTGLQGDLAFPTNDGGISATWEGEVDTVAATKNAIGKKTMKPNRLAVTALISLQNLFQSSIDLERFTIDDINAVVGNEMDSKGINGSGASNQPLGILNTPGIGSVVAGDPDGGAPSWDNIIDLESEIYIANANAAQMAYLINPGTKGKLKKTKHQAGDANYLMATDNTINGYRVGVSTLVPSNLTKGAGTNLNAGIFGDFKQYIMGQWGFYDMVVDNITRKKDGYVEITVNTFVDMMLRHAKAFCAVKDWNIS